MIFSISTTHYPATDIGFLLHKNPDEFHKIPFNFGDVYIFYPYGSPELCMATLIVKIDPIKLYEKSFIDVCYDFPFIETEYEVFGFSLFSMLLSKIYVMTLNGISNSRSELVNLSIPLSANIINVMHYDKVLLIKEFFEQLEYNVRIENKSGNNNETKLCKIECFNIEITAIIPLKNILSHLCIILAVLDNSLHYWMNENEIDKIIEMSKVFLKNHPMEDYIMKHLSKEKINSKVKAISFVSQDKLWNRYLIPTVNKGREKLLKKQVKFNEEKHNYIISVLKGLNSKSVVDIGCGEGEFIELLFKDVNFERILGVDVSNYMIEKAKFRIDLCNIPSENKERINIIQSSIFYRDKRLRGYEAATVINVIEYFDLPRLKLFEQVLFGLIQPQHVIIVISSVEFIVKKDSISNNKFNNVKNVFEWTKEKYKLWYSCVAEQYDYTFRLLEDGYKEIESETLNQIVVFSLKGDDR